MSRTYGFYSSAALFLLPALCMVVPSGYGYGAGLLLLAALFHAKAWREPRHMPAHGWWLYASFVGLALVWLLDDWLSARGGRSFEKPLKILVTLPCMWYLLVRRPRAEWLWRGVCFGVVAAFAYSAYQFFWQGNIRASAAMFPIHFADIVLMFGCMALCAWNWPVQRVLWWRAGLVAVAFLGLLASVFSGTRGAWLVFLLLLGVYLAYLICSRKIGFKYMLAGIFGILLIGYGLCSLPQLRIEARVKEARDEVVWFYQNGTANTSVGARLQMWGFAWDLYKTKPVFCWSYKGYRLEQTRRIADKKLDPMLDQDGFDHPHNELLNAAAKTGSVGLLALLLVYICPFFVFARWFRRGIGNARLRALSSAGMLVPVAYFGAGLTEEFLPHNSPAVIYFFMLVLIWGACLAVEADSGSCANSTV